MNNAKYIIQGGRELAGIIKVAGAKNAALKIIPAALLSDDPVTIHNLPQINDVKNSLDLITGLGATVAKTDGAVVISADNIKNSRFNEALARKFRTSIMFAGPLLARTGEVTFFHPGGCVIGRRPIDMFLDGFRAMGAEVVTTESHYHITANQLRGTNYFFPKISVTATESLMLTAVLARGRTILKNAASEPEIIVLADYLNQCGARIKGSGTATIIIDGVAKITAGQFKVMPDRIETGTFAIMAAATGSELRIVDCIPEHVEALLNIFGKIGVPFEQGDDYLIIKKARNLKPYSVTTHEYPGFATDLASAYAVLATQAHGTSMIFETIFERRLLFTDMLAQMGANVTMCDLNRVLISGPTKLYGKNLTSPDLRAGIAMVIAGLIAEGQTVIDNIYQIERGYENIVERLKGIGADIEKM